MTNDRYAEFAAFALGQMGCHALTEMLLTAPLTTDPDEVAFREACWAAVLVAGPASAA